MDLHTQRIALARDACLQSYVPVNGRGSFPFLCRVGADCIQFFLCSLGMRALCTGGRTQLSCEWRRERLFLTLL